ncbi:MAG: enolase C-terminal domain-like protein [Methylococcales bacterium]
MNIALQINESCQVCAFCKGLHVINDEMLKIKHIRYSELKIPFTRTFSHGSANRDETETVIVQVVDESGLIGYGEGCPRSYVTGESVETVFKFFKKHRTSISHIKTLDEIKSYLSECQAEIDENPAGWCAMELALLDLLAKTEQVNVEKLLGITKKQPEYIYSAILGDSEPEVFHQLFQQYRQLGFVDYKIKLSNNFEKDRKKLRCMNACINEITVRADANNLWDSTSSAISYLNDLSFDFYAIEEPIQSKQIVDLQFIAAEIQCKVILDESLLRFEQIEQLKQNPNCWIVNARVSKYGGILRSLKIIDELVKSDIDIIVGAHVGETSLLTRSALLLADKASDKLTAQEGGFSTHLLTKDPFQPNLKIGRAGKFGGGTILDCMNKPGFGVNKINSD